MLKTIVNTAAKKHLAVPASALHVIGLSDDLWNESLIFMTNDDNILPMHFNVRDITFLINYT